MKKQYIQPAFMQVTLAAKTLIAASLLIDDNSPQNYISGDVKEYGYWDNTPSDINLWDNEW